MQMMMRTCALGALVVLAGSVQAAVVTLGGDFSGTFGSSAPAAVGSFSQVGFSSTLADASVQGLVRFSNFYDSTPGFESQGVELTLTNFTFQSTGTGPRTLSVRIVQDYVLLGSNGTPATAAHQVNGNANFSAAGQSFSLNVTSQHEATALPTLTRSGSAFGPSSISIIAGQGPVTSVGVSPFFYTIDTTYTFTLNAGGLGLASVVLPDSGVDNATIRVPGPSVAALLAMGGLVAARRRRVG